MSIDRSVASNLKVVLVYRPAAYPGEQNPEGEASPEEPQYLPGGQRSQANWLDKPICLLKAPAGHGNAAADCVPVDE